FRRSPILAVVFRYFVERVDADVQNIAVTIDQFDGLLLFALHIDFLQSAKLPDTMVDMGDIIPDFQFVEFLQGDGLFFGIAIFQMELMVSLKNLMVRVAGQFQVVVDETLKKWKNHGLVVDSLIHFFKNIVETLGLLFRGAKNIICETCIPIIVQVFKDRKSTRLNSSHVKISYAVFC